MASQESAAAAGAESGDHPVFWEPSRVFLKISIGCILCSALIYEVVLYFFAPGQITRALAVGVIVLVATAAWGLLARGRARAAVHMLAVGVWLHITVSAFFLGGISSTPIIIYPVTILLIGWLVGTVQGLIFTTLVILFLFLRPGGLVGHTGSGAAH